MAISRSINFLLFILLILYSSFIASARELKDLEKAIAVDHNKLARFKQRPEGKTHDFKAKATTLIYYIKKEEIHLLENARVEQEDSSFSGHKIIYDTKKETVVASGKKDKQGKPISASGRVKVTIPPKKKPK